MALDLLLYHIIFGTSIWYSWVFHNVRVLHHVMQFLNDRLLKNVPWLTWLTDRVSSRDPPNLKTQMIFHNLLYHINLKAFSLQGPSNYFTWEKIIYLMISNYIMFLMADFNILEMENEYGSYYYIFLRISFLPGRRCYNAQKNHFTMFIVWKASVDWPKHDHRSQRRLQLETINSRLPPRCIHWPGLGVDWNKYQSISVKLCSIKI